TTRATDPARSAQLRTPPPPRSPPRPYTTLFRSPPAAPRPGARPSCAAPPRPGPRAAACSSGRPALVERPPETARRIAPAPRAPRSEEHTAELQSLRQLVCRLLLEKKKRLHGRGL